MKNLRVRAADKEDIFSVINIEKLCYADPWSGLSYSEMLSDENSFAVLIDEETVIGYSVVNYRAEAELYKIAVIPERRGEGNSKILMDAVIEETKKRNFKKIGLEVRAGNETAINLYKRYGFVCVGNRKNYYKKPVEDAVLMDLKIN